MAVVEEENMRCSTLKFSGIPQVEPPPGDHVLLGLVFLRHLSGCILSTAAGQRCSDGLLLGQYSHTLASVSSTFQHPHPLLIAITVLRAWVALSDLAHIHITQEISLRTLGIIPG